MILYKYRRYYHLIRSSLLFLIMSLGAGESALATDDILFRYSAEKQFVAGSESSKAVNSIPLASNDEATTREDQPVSFSIIENDSDSDGLLLANTVDLDVSVPGLQSVFELAGAGTYTSDGAGNVTFVPVPDFFGITTPIFYTIQDDAGETSNQASIIVDVLPVNDSPVFTKGGDQTVCATEVSSVSLPWATGIKAGPVNEVSQALSFVITSISDPSIFVALPEISANGVLSFTPVRSANGSAVISVLLKDDGGVDNGGTDVSAEQTFTITVKSVSILSNVTNVSCNGATDGKIDLVVSGGTPPYSYLWNDQSDLQNRSNLAPGNYRVDVTDSEGCSTFAEFVVTEPGILNGTLVKTDVTCFGGSDGTVSVNLPSGGSGNYEFSINGGQSWQPENIFSGLSADDFTVLIRDADEIGCYRSLGSVTLTQPNQISVLAAITPCTCIGSSTGAIDLTVTGSTGSYRYLWSNGATTQDLTGVPSGPYSVVVSDMNNCSTIGPVSFYVDARNNVPVSVDKYFNIDEDGLLSGELSVNDLASCDGGNVWTLRGENGGTQNGVVSLNADGSFSYLPNPNFWGSDEFVYSLCDINGDCSIARVTINVNSVNDLPVADNDVFITDEDVAIFGQRVFDNDLLSGDGGNTWSLIGVNGGALNGKVTMYPDGTFDYIPAPDFNGSDYFIYKICDNDGDCEAALVTVILNSVGDIPYAFDDVFSTSEEVSITAASVATNDKASGDGGNSWSLFGNNGGAQHGKVTMNGSGVFTYIPDANFTGTDSFIYFICDNDNDCTAAIASISVLPVNDKPTAKDDIGVTLRGYALTGDLLTNDRDIDGEQVTINTKPVKNPVHGSVLINADGTYSYTPDKDYSGSDSFTYEVCDNGQPSLCDQATVSVAVVGFVQGNNEPVAIDDNFQGLQGYAVNGNVISNDFDSDGNLNTNSITILGLDPPHGIFQMQPNGKFVFSPEAGFTGKVSFQYRICDNGSSNLCSVATATIEILSDPAKNPTYVTDDVYFGASDNVVVSGNVFLNDNHQPGELKLSGTSPVVEPQNGKLLLNVDGSFLYAPNKGFYGHDQFVYEVCDGISSDNCQRATVYLLIARENHPPQALADTLSTSQDVAVSGNLLDNDSDLDGDSILISLVPVAGPFNGTVTILPDGSFDYMPNSGFAGVDSFSYSVCDDGLPVLCSEALVKINVAANPKENFTVAVDDSFFGIEGNQIVGNVLSNDFDREGDQQTVNRTPIANSSHGSLTLSNDGSFVYIPDQGFSGTDYFIYEVCDSGQPVACDQARVTLEVAAADKLPDALADALQTNEDLPLSGNVAANDIPGDGANVWTIVSLAENGELTMSSTGTFVYTPDQDFNGSDSFVYQMCDADGDCSTATVTILVQSVNDLPVAADDEFVLYLDAVLTGDVALNDTESGDGENSWTVVRQPASGRLVLNQDGTFTYTPNPAFGGADSFTYRLCDADGDCDEALVQIEYEDVVEPNQVLTPNDDGKNDTFIIEGIENYPVNSLTIFNRWGSVVYTKKGYQNEWSGSSNKNTVGGSSLPAGTYFYVLDYGNNRHQTGYVYLDR